MRRVVITGLGTVNALGSDAPTSFERMLKGENGVQLLEEFDTSDLAVKFSASVEWNPEERFNAPDFRKLDRFTMFALKAAAEAMGDAGLSQIAEQAEEDRERYGSIIGTGIGGIRGIEEQYATMLERGPRRVSPHFIPKIMANAVSGQVAIEFGLLGTAFTTSSACASSGHAMGMALYAIKSGEIDLCVTGGTESATTKLAMSGFASAKALSRATTIPRARRAPLTPNATVS